MDHNICALTIHMHVLSLEVLDHLLEIHMESDGVEVGKVESQSSSLRHEFWALKQPT